MQGHGLPMTCPGYSLHFVVQMQNPAKRNEINKNNSFYMSLIFAYASLFPFSHMHSLIISVSALLFLVFASHVFCLAILLVLDQRKHKASSRFGILSLWHVVTTDLPHTYTYLDNNLFSNLKLNKVLHYICITKTNIY